MHKELTLDDFVLDPRWSEIADSADFAVESIPSCYHYLCENSFGLSVTHPKWEQSWVDELRADTAKYHGESAACVLDTAVNLTGEDPGTGLETMRAVEWLLRLAMLYSHRHREELSADTTTKE